MRLTLHTYMLRHGCGYKLATVKPLPYLPNLDSSSYGSGMGHRSIPSMVRYTALAPDRFKGFWKD